MQKSATATTTVVPDMEPDMCYTLEASAEFEKGKLSKLDLMEAYTKNIINFNLMRFPSKTQVKSKHTGPHRGAVESPLFRNVLEKLLFFLLCLLN